MFKVNAESLPLTFPKPITGATPVLSGVINSLSGASQSLGDLIGGGAAGTGFPTYIGPTVADKTFPKAVILAVIGTNEVEVAYNQTPTLGATSLGDQIPQSPSFYRITFPDAIAKNQINIIGTAGTVVKWRLEW